MPKHERIARQDIYKRACEHVVQATTLRIAIEGAEHPQVKYYIGRRARMFWILWREAKQTGADVCLEKWLNKCTKKQKAAAWNAMVRDEASNEASSVEC
jgi:hypothetical protein